MTEDIKSFEPGREWSYVVEILFFFSRLRAEMRSLRTFLLAKWQASMRVLYMTIHGFNHENDRNSGNFINEIIKKLFADVGEWNIEDIESFAQSDSISQCKKYIRGHQGDR